MTVMVSISNLITFFFFFLKFKYSKKSKLKKSLRFFKKYKYLRIIEINRNKGNQISRLLAMKFAGNIDYKWLILYAKMEMKSISRHRRQKGERERRTYVFLLEYHVGKTAVRNKRPD